MEVTSDLVQHLIVVVNQLTESGKRIYKIVREQLANRRIDQAAILRHLPTGTLHSVVDVITYSLTCWHKKDMPLVRRILI